MLAAACDKAGEVAIIVGKSKGVRPQRSDDAQR
jgi:hypothetical protein